MLDPRRYLGYTVQYMAHDRGVHHTVLSIGLKYIQQDKYQSMDDALSWLDKKDFQKYLAQREKWG